jgi:hypothetical protein
LWVLNDTQRRTTKKSSDITYADANHLRVWAMVEPLSYEDIKVDCPTLDSFLETPDDAETRYFIEADLVCPQELHEKLQ